MVREGPSAEVTFGKKPAYGEKVSHFINTKFWANSTRASRIVLKVKSKLLEFYLPLLLGGSPAVVTAVGLGFSFMAKR